MGEIGRGRIEQSLAWRHQVPRLLAAYKCLLGVANDLPRPVGQSDPSSPGCDRVSNAATSIAAESERKAEHVEALGIKFSRYSLEALVSALMSEIPVGSGARMVATANVDHVVKLAKDEKFRGAYGRSWVNTADGWPVYLYARLRGVPVYRVTGADIFSRVMHRLDPRRHRPFFVVGSVVLGDRVKDWLRHRGFPADAIAMAVPKFGFEHDSAASHALALSVQKHRTTHLIMGLGAPKSEIWSDIHRDIIGDAYVLCLGASAEFFTGIRPRAPYVLRLCGLEWLWRFCMEPRRLFSRYFVDSWLFLKILARDLMLRGHRGR